MTDGALARLRERIDALPPLREVVAEAFPARKSLGQHFLFDLNLTDKIARTARRPGASPEAPLEGDTVVEVGPGPGGLTRSLLKAGAHVVAVEKDLRAAEVLAPLVAAADGRLTLVTADALTADWTALAPAGASICANLPYNVGTPLIVDWLSGPWLPWWASATVMVQREVADRIVATPGGGDYGRLAVLTGARAHATSVFDVSPSAFVPPPKVWSSVVRIDPKPADDVPLKALERVTAAAFGQRRKMLRSSLKSLTQDPEGLLAAAELEPTERAERIPVADFIRLAKVWQEREGG